MGATEGHIRLAVVRLRTEASAAYELTEHCFIDEPFHRNSDMTSTWDVLEQMITSIN